MIVLVTGGRNYANRDLVFETLDKLHAKTPITCVVHGGANGADSLADFWAVTRNINQSVFPANWKKYGRSAGPIRNQVMIWEGKPELVVAFPGGDGTADMVSRATGAGVRVLTIVDGGES